MKGLYAKAVLLTVFIIPAFVFVASISASAATKTFAIDYSVDNGKIDIILGENRNPKRYTTQAGTVDMTAKLRDVGVTVLRTHGIAEDHSHPTNLEGMFPDWKSEWWNGDNTPFMDPANYNFDNAQHTTPIPGTNTYSYAVSSDGKIDDIIQNGFDVLFRLGYTPNTDNKWSRFSYLGYTYMPNPIPDTDSAREKVAIVCENILKHYNEGWSSGRQNQIKLWEVWNEPDMKDMWGRDLSSYDLAVLGVQFHKMYAAIARKFRGTRTDPIRPEIKIGPCAVAWTDPATNYHLDKSRKFCEELLQYCSANNVPVDFYSWHEYGGLSAATAPGVNSYFFGGNAYTYLQCASRIKNALQANGYPNTLSICDEWNSLCDGNNPYHDTYLAAAFTACALMYMDYADVYMANYWPMMRTWGLWDEYANYTKEAYAFKAFSMLRNRTPNRLKITNGLVMDVTAGSGDNFGAMAGKSDDGNTLQILLADENQKWIKKPGSTEWLSANGSYWVSNAISDSTRQSYNEFRLVINNLPANHRCKVTYQTIDSNGVMVETPGGSYYTTDTEPRIILLRNWTPPAVCLVRVDMIPETEIGAAKNQPSGSDMYVSDAIVTAVIPEEGAVFVESRDRSSGIKLITGLTPVIGQMVRFGGVIDKSGAECRVVDSDVAEVAAGTPLTPLTVVSRDVKAGTIDHLGLDTYGLLVRVAGSVSGVVAGDNTVYVDDGGIGDTAPFRGVRVKLPEGVALPAVGTMVGVTGVCRIVDNQPLVWVRESDDLTVYQ